MPAPKALMFLALITIAIPLDAAALVPCAKVRTSTGEIRGGTPIRLRTACKSNEIEVDLTGPDGVPGLSCWDLNESFTCDAEEDVAPPLGCGVEDCVGVISPAPRIVLVDADGDEVGEFVSEPVLDESVKYILHEAPDAQIPAALSVTTATMYVSHAVQAGPLRPDIAYATPDCSGSPYVVGLVPGVPEVSFYPGTFRHEWLAADLGVDLEVIFYFLAGTPSTSLPMQSRRTQADFFASCLPDATVRPVYDVGFLDVHDFRPPYTIENR